MSSEKLLALMFQIVGGGNLQYWQILLTIWIYEVNPEFEIFYENHLLLTSLLPFSFYGSNKKILPRNKISSQYSNICICIIVYMGLYQMETSQLIYFAKRLAGFRMVLLFAERYFCVVYVLIVLTVKLLSAVVIVVLSKSLVYCYYVVCN